MEIRQAVPNDADILAGLCLEIQGLHVQLQPLVFQQPSHQELADLFRERIADPDWAVFLAFDSDKPVAYVVLHIIRRPADIFFQARNMVEIDHVHIIETYRKQGICRQLAAKALDLARSLRIENIQLCVWADNEGAVAAFNALGFRPQVHMMYLENVEKLESEV